jgi:hypothetical protein
MTKYFLSLPLLQDMFIIFQQARGLRVCMSSCDDYTYSHAAYLNYVGDKFLAKLETRLAPDDYYFGR